MADTQTLLGQEHTVDLPGGGRWYLRLNNPGNRISWAMEVTGGGSVGMSGGDVTLNEFHHVAAIKNGSDYGVYLDGIQVSYASSANTGTFASPLDIGSSTFSFAPFTFSFFDGQLDEVRIEHSNVFNASPIGGLTDTITVPTSPQSPDAAGLGDGLLQQLGEDRPGGRGHGDLLSEADGLRRYDAGRPPAATSVDGLGATTGLARWWRPASSLDCPLSQPTCQDLVIGFISGYRLA